MISGCLGCNPYHINLFDCMDEVYTRGADVGLVETKKEVEDDFQEERDRVSPVYEVVGNSVRLVRRDFKGRNLDFRA